MTDDEIVKGMLATIYEVSLSLVLWRPGQIPVEVVDFERDKYGFVSRLSVWDVRSEPNPTQHFIFHRIGKTPLSRMPKWLAPVLDFPRPLYTDKPKSAIFAKPIKIPRSIRRLKNRFSEMVYLQGQQRFDYGSISFLVLGSWPSVE